MVDIYLTKGRNVGYRGLRDDFYVKAISDDSHICINYFLEWKKVCVIIELKRVFGDC